MIAFHASALVRLFLVDDRSQTSQAVPLVRQIGTSGDMIHVSVAVLVELFSKLRSQFCLTKAELFAVFGRLLENTLLDIAKERLVIAFIDEWRIGLADFADYLIAYLSRETSRSTIRTFYPNASRSPGFTLVPA